MSDDFFELLGVPRRLRLDAALLEQRFRTLSRQCHPDFFHNASPAERQASLERSSAVNDAYRVLKQPMSRLEHLLRLEGVMGDGAPSSGIPPALLEEVFALNEALDDVRAERAVGAPTAAWRARLDAARRPIAAMRAEHERRLDELAARWDALADGGDASGRVAVLDALRDRLLERTYLDNLLTGIDRELGVTDLEPASRS